MAFFACHHGVVSDERKSRDAVIEGDCAAPFVLAMASLAATAKLSIVHVIIAMARRTCCCQLIAIHFTGVARIALNLCMCGPEGEFRVLIVIKADRAPLVLFVAGSALGAVPPSMDILNPVAVDTRCPDSLVAFADMARQTGGITVRSLQRKPGLVVVERLCASPYGFAMTIIARFPQTPLMRIFRLMTIEATPWCVAELHILCVTAVALQRLVGASKLEIRGCVIKCLAIKHDDVGISPLVIGMTISALLFRCIRSPPVKSPDQLTIDGRLSMACQT